jgi:hypothetical protein
MAPETQCPVCSHRNHHLAVTCSSCGAYLQTKVENLDLFVTAWNVLESPRRAFHTVAVARHKNYILPLSGLTGVALTFFAFWLLKAGNSTTSIINFLVAGVGAGIPAGLASMLVLALLVKLTALVYRHKVRFRNALAVSAYAALPLVISVILVLPLEIMTFGVYFFSTNPSPSLLKPTSYVLLLCLDGVFAVWALVLFLVGVRTLTNVSWLRAMSMECVILGLFSLMVAGILSFLR